MRMREREEPPTEKEMREAAERAEEISTVTSFFLLREPVRQAVSTKKNLSEQR